MNSILTWTGNAYDLAPFIQAFVIKRMSAVEVADVGFSFGGFRSL